MQVVRRWFNDSLQEALRGDVKQQALVGQMYAEGYGCEQDLRAAREWAEKAEHRGYDMQGVYCEL
jgi:TPR repeat protein